MSLRSSWLGPASTALVTLAAAAPLLLWLWFPEDEVRVVGAAASASVILGIVGLRLALPEREPVQPRRAIGWSLFGLAVLIWVVPLVAWIVMLAVVGDGTIGGHV